MEMIFITGALVVFSALVGVIVKRMLDANAELREKRLSDDVFAKAVGDREDLPEFVRAMIREKRAQKLRAELPDALDMISNSLSAGLTLPQALIRNLDHFPGLVQGELARVIYDTRVGFSISDAFANFARRTRVREVQLIAIASRIGVEHGGNLADSYRMLSELIRDRLAFEAELRAMTTEGRMQAIVMSCLPFVMALILAVVNWELMEPLFTTVAGWATIGVLCLMLCAAYLWIGRIVRIEM